MMRIAILLGFLGLALATGLIAHSGYADVMATKARQMKAAPVTTKASVVETPKAEPAVVKKAKKLSYKLQLELDGLPAELESLEQQIESLQEKINQPEFFSVAVEETQPILDALQKAESDLEIAFMRWEELEALQNEGCESRKVSYPY